MESFVNDREALRAGGRTLHGWLRLFGFTFAVSASSAFPMCLYVFLLDLAVGWRTAVPPLTLASSLHAKRQPRDPRTASPFTAPMPSLPIQSCANQSPTTSGSLG